MPPPRFTRVHRQFKGHKTPEQLEFEPDRYQKCLHWSWYVEDFTGVRHKRPCKKCRDCRNFKHERIVGQAMAQAQTASCIMSFTLTYRPELGVKRLDYDHIQKFLKRLRKAGFRFVKICCGEYGGQKGAPHWHLLLLFDWREDTKQKILNAVSQGKDYQHIGRGENWRKLVPRHVANLRGQAFQDAIMDPDQLVISYPQRGKTPKIRNPNWRFWGHGIVEAQMVKSPEFNAPEQIEGAVRYPLKYLSKDAWKDSRKYQRIPFEKLPEHIRQQTRFGPWYTQDEIEQQFDKDVAAGMVKQVYENQRKTGQEHRKWRYGNDYVKQLKIALLKDFTSDEDVPPDRQIMEGQYHYKAVGGLGADYFKALGAFHALNPRYSRNDENLRLYELGGNFLYDQPGLGRSTEIDVIGEARYVRDSRGKITVHRRKRYKYSMGDTSYRMFWQGFNAQRCKMGQPTTEGPDGVVDQLDTSRTRASDASTGSFGNYYWKKSSVSARRVIEENTATIPDEDLRGFWPTRWRRSMETTSLHWGWRKKGLDRQLALIRADSEKHGLADPSLTVPFLRMIKSVRKALVKNQLRHFGRVPTGSELGEIKYALNGYATQVNSRDAIVHQLEPDPLLSAEHWQTSEERHHAARSAMGRRKTQLYERWLDDSEPDVETQVPPTAESALTPAIETDDGSQKEVPPNFRTANRVDAVGPQFLQTSATSDAAKPSPTGPKPKPRPNRALTLWRYSQSLKRSGGLENRRKR